MRQAQILATALGVLLIARGVAAQDATAGSASAAAPPLDSFTASYGYPTFPVAPQYDVPYIWNGPDYDALRIGDLTKIPTLNQAASTVPGAPSRPGTGSSSQPGIGVFSHH